VLDEPEACYRAVQSKDPRFDGWFFTAVTTTGIYCRPSCPAMTPKRENVRFYPSAAAAQQAGFRACKRCRPDASPGSPEWNARADVVARAMRLIADGTIDREGVTGVASRVGYSIRQLQRQMLSEVGAAPLALARAQRAQNARILIETTSLSFTEVAFGAGFTSIRQFNDTVRAVFSMTPTEMRRRWRREPRTTKASAEQLTLRLPFRPPFHAEGVLGHLAATAVPGVEEWTTGSYRRTLRLPHGPAVVTLSPLAGHVQCGLRVTDLRDVSAAVARCRRLLDLDADPVAVDLLLSADDVFAPLINKAPGRRVPRTVDASELALRAVIGQQVSTAGARTVSGRLTAAAGTPLPAPDGGLTHLFPTPEALLGLDDKAFPMPAARRETLRRLSVALAEGDLCLDTGADWTDAARFLGSLQGIGPWTASIICMRGLGDPDAFPAGDLGVVSAARALGLPDGRRLEDYSQRWRPWRAYATQYLWGALDHPINHYPEPNP
jgi:AraC family transcriptional regulator of adaptative response / DNA-3-methyladenine glycosylase II